MKNYNYDRNNVYKEFARLPKGGYVLKILNVKYEEGQNGNSDKLRLMVDVAEGEYTDFFKKDYEADTREDKKWRGVIEIWCPKNDGSEKDSWTQKTFNTCFAAIEDSNPGFRFDGVHEEALKGKKVGGIYYREDYTKDGKAKENYKFYKTLVTVDAIQKGTFKTPNDKILKNEDAPTVSNDSEGFMNIPTGIDEELPF